MPLRQTEMSQSTQFSMHFSGQPRERWLAQYANNASNSFTSIKPIHKMDGNPGEVTVIQY
jgi:hypothetical protein